MTSTPTTAGTSRRSERLDRNWNEILQELRVTQNGAQILTGFLLAIAFQTKFDTLTEFQNDIYLVLVSAAVATTALGLAAGQPAPRAVPQAQEVGHRR